MSEVYRKRVSELMTELLMVVSRMETDFTTEDNIAMRRLCRDAYRCAMNGEETDFGYDWTLSQLDLLEGLHLSNRLNKDVEGGRVLYR